jgi:hypothetical protein
MKSRDNPLKRTTKRNCGWKCGAAPNRRAHEISLNVNSAITGRRKLEDRACADTNKADALYCFFTRTIFTLFLSWSSMQCVHPSTRIPPLFITALEIYSPSLLSPQDLHFFIEFFQLPSKQQEQQRTKLRFRLFQQQSGRFLEM